jgi:hypothetical protein
MSNTIGRTDTAAYTFVAVCNIGEIEETISAPDQKTARREFVAMLGDNINSVESIELIEVERF